VLLFIFNNQQAEDIMNIKVSSTNSNGSTKTAVRVYIDGVKVAEVFPTSRNPLKYIQSHEGKYKESLLAQCREAGMTEELIYKYLGV